MESALVVENENAGDSNIDSEGDEEEAKKNSDKKNHKHFKNKGRVDAEKQKNKRQDKEARKKI